MEARINRIDLSSFALLLLLVLSAVLFLYAKHYGKRKSRPNLPLGSMGWPYIGETIAFYKKHPTYSLGRYLQNRNHRYGKIFKSNILGKPTIVSVDAEFNRFILQNEGQFFEISFPETVRQILGEQTIFTESGEGHKESRSIALKFLSNDMLRTRFLPDIEQTALLVINEWKDGMCLSTTAETRKFTFYMMAKNILSMEPGKPESEKIRKQYATFMPGIVSIPLNSLELNIGRLSRCIYNTCFTKKRKYIEYIYIYMAYSWEITLLINDLSMQSQSEICSEIGRMADLRMEEMRQGEMKGYNDLLCWCLTEFKLSREKMFDLLLGILFGGFETTSMALSLVIFFLGQCPKALQELKDEHLRIARRKTERGETKLNWEDYKKMEFTECVVKETLRLANVAKYLHRKVTQDVHYQGYDIPRGWKVLPVLSAVHLDGSIHKDPQEFNPWRWQHKSENTADMMPFGGGNRLCPGTGLVKLQLAVFLHHLVLNYRWELVKHDEPLAFPYVEFEKGLPIQVFKINN
ncbi:cytochrome P450 90B1-like protein [Carex littledalei]|uniref:Cytochrome P450 90B1-like protein n=1 Tax=Carex littledalei TaxID=544730 RepID=A0A833V5L6_9POAL|nr:cytochrome P450 90B1-like protein [Carex littledalei]